MIKLPRDSENNVDIRFSENISDDKYIYGAENALNIESIKDDVLIHIDTPKLEFVLKGNKYGFSNKECIRLDTFGHYVNITCNNNIYLQEYSNYEVIIRSKGNYKIEFFHENINIRNKVKPVISGLLTGIINFKGDIGFTDIIIKCDKISLFKLTLEVYPSKISYKEDYIALLEDINTEVYNLSYGFLARTYLSSELNNHKNNSYTEFYSILNYVMEKLLKAIDIITSNPYYELIKSTEIVKYHNIKKSGYETLRYIERNPKVIKKVNKAYVPERAMQSKKTVTVDTKENKFTKLMILRIQEKLQSFIKRYYETKGRNISNKTKFKEIISSNCLKINNSYDEEFIKKLLKFNKLLDVKLKNTFLKNVSGEYMEGSLSHVFTMGNGYKELYKYYLMLQKGLSIKSSIFSLSMKELSLLYEYWCFIKINSIIQKKYNLIKTDFLKINKDGIVVSLKKGMQSKFIYENPKTKERFIVFYNSKKYSRTVRQKPDNILSLYKENCSTSYEFIFDAKYKIDNSLEYKVKHKTPGPKEEDINTMHRYRDAIIYDYKRDYNILKELYKDKEFKGESVKNHNKEINEVKDHSKENQGVYDNILKNIKPKEIENKYKNCIFGAFVLFPYNDEEKYKNNTFYKSIEEVNIGGIPFLPSTTTIMEEFLDELINEDADCIFERTLHHIGE